VNVRAPDIGSLKEPCLCNIEGINGGPSHDWATIGDAGAAFDSARHPAGVICRDFTLGATCAFRRQVAWRRRA